MKYRLTNSTKKMGQHILYQIESLKDIPEIGVKKGERGGFIEAEACLSQMGICWIDEYSEVYKNAQVLDDAVIKSSTISNAVKIRGNSSVYNYYVIGKGKRSKSELVDVHLHGKGKNQQLCNRSNLQRVTLMGAVSCINSVIEDTKLFGVIDVLNSRIYSDSSLHISGKIINSTMQLKNSEVYGPLCVIDSQILADNLTLCHTHIEESTLKLNQSIIGGGSELRNVKTDIVDNVEQTTIYGEVEMLDIVLIGSNNQILDKAFVKGVMIQSNVTIRDLTSISSDAALVLNNQEYRGCTII